MDGGGYPIRQKMAIVRAYGHHLCMRHALGGECTPSEQEVALLQTGFEAVRQEIVDVFGQVVRYCREVVREIVKAIRTMVETLKDEFSSTTEVGE